MSDREDTFRELARRYEEEFHVPVKFELFAPSLAYEQKVKASVQTNTLPDIYGVLGEKRDLASFIKSGYIADLTLPLTEKTEGSSWKDKLFERAVAVNEFLPGNEFGVEPGIYGVPLDVMTVEMLYNKHLYAVAGLDPEAPPVTWDQFIEHCRVLKAKGIPRFVSGFSESWMLNALSSNYAMNIMGQEKVFDTFAGKVPYTDPHWIKVLSLFKQMADEKVLVEGAVTMPNKTAEQTFANERAAYAFNGSWSVNVYKGMNPGLQYAAILPPKVSTAHPMKVWGGAGTSFVVNAGSPRREAAIAFLKWLTMEKQQLYFTEQTENLPSNKAAVGKLSPVLAEFASNMDNAIHPNVYPVHEDPAVIETMSKGIQSILISDKTPEEIARQVQQAKEKSLSGK